MDPTDLGLDANTLASVPGLGGILLHGQDFFDRPSGTLIPQFASPLVSYLDGRTLVGTSNYSTTGATAQADATGLAANPPTLDYDHFSDRVDSQPAPSAYDQFSDALPNESPRSVEGLFSDARASSEVGQGTSADSSDATSSDGAPRSVGGLFSDAVARSQVGPGVQSDPVWDPLGEVAASAPVGRAIGSFVEKVVPNDADVLDLEGQLKDGTFQPTPLDSYGRGTAQTFTAGLNHKLYGAMVALRPSSAGLSMSERYHRAVAAQESADNVAATQNLKSYLAGQATGVAGMVLGGEALGAGAAALRGGTAAAEETGALATEALASRGAQETADAAGLTTQSRIAANAAQDSVGGAEATAESADALAADNPAQAVTTPPSGGATVGAVDDASVAANTHPAAVWKAMSLAERQAVKNRLAEMIGDIKEGVYQFASGTLQYVGQTSRGIQKLQPKDIESIIMKAVGGGKLNRELAETQLMKQLGGLPNLANKQYSVGQVRLQNLIAPP